MVGRDLVTSLVVVCCLSAAHLAWGAVEIHYARKYKTINFECAETWGNLRVWLLAAGALKLATHGLKVVAGACALVFFSAAFRDQKVVSRQPPRIGLCAWLHTLDLVILLWALGASSRLMPMDSACRIEWESHAPELLHLLHAEMAMAYVVLGCTILGCCFGVCWCVWFGRHVNTTINAEYRAKAKPMEATTSSSSSPAGGVVVVGV